MLDMASKNLVLYQFESLPQ